MWNVEVDTKYSGDIFKVWETVGRSMDFALAKRLLKIWNRNGYWARMVQVSG